MAAHFADASAVQHDDAVGILHRRQPVRDDDRGAARPAAFRGRRGSAARFPCRCWRWLRPGRGSSGRRRGRARRPAAASGRPTATSRVRPPVRILLELSDESRRVHGLGGRLHLLVRDVLVSQADVVRHGAGEQETRPGGRSRWTGAAPAGRTRLCPRPSIRISPWLDVVETAQQRDDRRFAGARGADERDLLARLPPLKEMSCSTGSPGL